jgi:hypothetical protein
LRCEAVGPVGIGIEVVADPFRELGMPLMPGVLDGGEEFSKAPRATAIFGRAAAGDFDEARIELPGSGSASRGGWESRSAQPRTPRRPALVRKSSERAPKSGSESNPPTLSLSRSQRTASCRHLHAFIVLTDRAPVARRR